MNSNLLHGYELLNKGLKKLGYTRGLVFKEMIDQNPAIFLGILHFIFIDGHKMFYNYLLENGYELYFKKDFKFLENIYQILIKELNFKPCITIQQFLSDGFLEAKITACSEIIKLVGIKNDELVKNKAQINAILKKNSSTTSSEFIQPQELPVKNSINHIAFLEARPESPIKPPIMEQIDNTLPFRYEENIQEDTKIIKNKNEATPEKKINAVNKNFHNSPDEHTINRIVDENKELKRILYETNKALSMITVSFEKYKEQQQQKNLAFEARIKHLEGCIYNKNI